MAGEISARLDRLRMQAKPVSLTFNRFQVDSMSMTVLFAICAGMNAIGAIIVGILLRTT
jgi:hypothetical protein